MPNSQPTRSWLCVASLSCLAAFALPLWLCVAFERAESAARAGSGLSLGSGPSVPVGFDEARYAICRGETLPAAHAENISRSRCADSCRASETCVAAVHYEHRGRCVRKSSCMLRAHSSGTVLLRRGPTRGLSPHRVHWHHNASLVLAWGLPSLEPLRSLVPRSSLGSLDLVIYAHSSLHLAAPAAPSAAANRSAPRGGAELACALCRYGELLRLGVRVTFFKELRELEGASPGRQAPSRSASASASASPSASAAPAARRRRFEQMVIVRFVLDFHGNLPPLVLFASDECSTSPALCAHLLSPRSLGPRLAADPEPTPLPAAALPAAASAEDGGAPPGGLAPRRPSARPLGRGRAPAGEAAAWASPAACLCELGSAKALGQASALATRSAASAWREWFSHEFFGGGLGRVRRALGSAPSSGRIALSGWRLRQRPLPFWRAAWSLLLVDGRYPGLSGDDWAAVLQAHWLALLHIEAAAERPPPSDPCFYGAPTCNARLRSADLPARLRARSEQLLRDSRVSLRRRFGAIGERFG